MDANTLTALQTICACVAFIGFWYIMAKKK